MDKFDSSIVGDEYKYAFSDYTPDFSEIAKDNYKLAEFILRIGLAQKAQYCIDATWTENKNQIEAFQKKYGYNVVDGGTIKIEHLTDKTVVDAIKSASPLIIGSSKEGYGGHSYILDGYKSDGNMNYVHIDYGYGGSDNGWFADITGTDYPNNLYVIIAYPNNAVQMKEGVPTLVVDDTPYSMNAESGSKLYKSKAISLKKVDNHSFCFKYTDNNSNVSSTK